MKRKGVTLDGNEKSTKTVIILLAHRFAGDGIHQYVFSAFYNFIFNALFTLINDLVYFMEL